MIIISPHHIVRCPPCEFSPASTPPQCGYYLLQISVVSNLPTIDNTVSDHTAVSMTRYTIVTL